MICVVVDGYQFGVILLIFDFELGIEFLGGAGIFIGNIVFFDIFSDFGDVIVFNWKDFVIGWDFLFFGLNINIGVRWLWDYLLDSFVLDGVILGVFLINIFFFISSVVFLFGIIDNFFSVDGVDNLFGKKFKDELVKNFFDFEFWLVNF